VNQTLHKDIFAHLVIAQDKLRIQPVILPGKKEKIKRDINQAEQIIVKMESSNLYPKEILEGMKERIERVKKRIN